MQRRIPLALTAIVALALTACGGGPTGTPTGQGGLTTLKVGTIGIGSDAAIQLAVDKGFFKDEGLEVQTSVVANPPAGVAAAQSGQLDLTYTPSIPLLNALSQNVPLTVVAAADGYSAEGVANPDLSKVDDTGLLVRKDSGITRPKDLEGKSVSVPARKAQFEVTISKVIKDDGGDPAKVNWLVLDPSSAMQSLSVGRIDAASLISPLTAKAISEGNVLLASPGVEFFGPSAVGLWVAGKSTVDSKKSSLQAFQRAIYKANAYANTHLDEAQQASAKITGTTIDVVKAGAVNYWPDAVKVEDIEKVGQSLVDLGFLAKPVKLGPDLLLGS